ncbi:hypothetical protein CF165_44750 [Amycolatopsis vastitatis]|uniref:Uncharacterized protein n=2 Tax=Amycolatopsis vastitatis TaxID=1905142 RepID=A0A229SMV0_9PSEU|nr:hypothetical protein CF165_44750 [Amycolatopsis vastitatis]
MTWVKAVITGIRVTTTSKLEGYRTEALHQATLGLSERQLDTSLVGGSVALAAWTQLFVSSESTPGSSISDTSLSLLFIGALALIAAPILFRTEGIHLTFIGRETGSHLGFGLVILSLLSMAADLSISWLITALAVLVGALLVLRDVSEVTRHVQLQNEFTF